MVRRLLSSLPAVAALLVAWALLGGGSEPVRHVQVLGGPTRSGATLSLLIRALESDGERRLPSPGLALRAVARSGNTRASFAGVADAEGLVEARFELGAPAGTVEGDVEREVEGDVELEVEEAASGRRLAAGPLSLAVDTWSAGARRGGGWLPGQAEGELEVDVAPGSGAFAVPFAGLLLVRVRRAGGGAEPVALAGARIGIELVGAELVGAEATPALPSRETDAAGMTRLLVRPDEHAVSLRVEALFGALRGTWYGALPVVPGALLASLEGPSIHVRSPIGRERGFLSLVTERERLAGAIVPLEPEPDGGSSGSFALSPALLARVQHERTWAVVSSEYDKRSAGVVGWPLPREPLREHLTEAALGSSENLPTTFDVADRVLLDGRDGALYDARQKQLARRRLAGAGLVGVGALMAGLFLYEVRFRRRAVSAPGAAPATDARLELSAAGIRSGGWILLVAVLSILLGIGALAYFGLSAR